MLVVIEIEDWSEDNAGLSHELRMLQDSQDRIVNDPLFDPDEPDEVLRIKTEDISIEAVRVVGTLTQVNAATPGQRYRIDPL